MHRMMMSCQQVPLSGVAAVFLCSRRSMVLATSALILAMTVPARADDVCVDLRSRLAKARDRRIPVGDVPLFQCDHDQSNQLQSARAGLRQLGCSTGSVKVYRTSTARQCSELASSVERMERNLRNLEAERSVLASTENGEEARARILAEIEANGCSGFDELGAVPASQATEAPSQEDEFPLDGLATRYVTSGGAGGRLRTVCVRTCDGGFFPVTSGASPLDFRRDQRVCASLCPKTETELYYQALDSSDSGEMVSTVTGRLYKQLPAAFAYRTRGLSKPQACGCGRIAYNSPATGTGIVKESTGSVTTIRMRPVGTRRFRKGRDRTSLRSGQGQGAQCRPCFRTGRTQDRSAQSRGRELSHLYRRSLPHRSA